MANPQPDKFIRISTELWEAFCLVKMPDTARRVWMAVARLTYGYNKKSDHISLSNLCLLTRLTERQVCRGKAWLVDNFMLLSTSEGKIKGNDPCKVMIQKDYERWECIRPLSKMTDLSEMSITPVKNDRGLTQQTPVKNDRHNRHIDNTINRGKNDGIVEKPVDNSDEKNEPFAHLPPTNFVSEWKE